MLERTLFPLCMSCSEPVPMTPWAKWRGFLIVCPNCGRWHGKYWHPKWLLTASLVFNALTYPFTMRPKRAALAIAATAAFWGIAILLGDVRIPDWLGITWVSLLIFV